MGFKNTAPGSVFVTTMTIHNVYYTQTEIIILYVHTCMDVHIYNVHAHVKWAFPPHHVIIIIVKWPKVCVN